MPTINYKNFLPIMNPDITGTVANKHGRGISFDFNDFPQKRKQIIVGFNSTLKAVTIDENGRGVFDDNTTIQLNHPPTSDYWLEPR